MLEEKALTEQPKIKRGAAMKYKVLDKQAIPFMKYFVDDQNTQYTEDALNAFLDDPTACGFVAK